MTSTILNFRRKVKMLDPKSLDWEKLRNPTEHIKVFVPTEDKMKEVARNLVEKRLYMQDYLRSYPTAHAMLNTIIFGPTLSILYELGNMWGIGGFINIVPEHKCEVILKFWTPEKLGPTMVREMKDTVDLVMKQFRLLRIDTDTPDENIVHLAKMLGFEREGARKYGFMFDRKPYTVIIMGRKRK
jgi:hypothetical protein